MCDGTSHLLSFIATKLNFRRRIPSTQPLKRAWNGLQNVSSQHAIVRMVKKSYKDRRVFHNEKPYRKKSSRIHSSSCLCRFFKDRDMENVIILTVWHNQPYKLAKWYAMQQQSNKSESLPAGFATTFHFSSRMCACIFAIILARKYNGVGPQTHLRLDWIYAPTLQIVIFIPFFQNFL